MKSDDDMFVNIPAIMNVIRSKDLRRSIIGRSDVKTGVRVRRRGKWALSPAEYPFDNYPTYMFGSIYLISADLLRPLLNASYFVPHVWIEDVYITGILAEIVGARQVSIDASEIWLRGKPSSCDVLGGHLLAGHVTSAHQRQIWKNFTTSIRVTCNHATNASDSSLLEFVRFTNFVIIIIITITIMIIV